MLRLYAVGLWISICSGLFGQTAEEAAKRYLFQPRYFAGKQVLAQDTATGWVTHRAAIKEVLPNDQYKLEVIEVLEFNSDKSPKRTRTVERVVPHEEVARLNDPTLLSTGKRYFGIRYEPQNDPLLREAIERANGIVDAYFPDFRKPAQEVLKQQRRLFLELMKVAKALDYPNSSPEYTKKMGEVSSDPFYGSRRAWAGAYLKGGYGVCVDQASVATQIIQSVARRAGIEVQLVSGITLQENAGHGFMAVDFRGDRTRYISDPTWETSRAWFSRNSPERYKGQLLLSMEEAMRSAGWGRNRRILHPEGEQVRTPPPSQSAMDKFTLKQRLGSEALGAGQYVMAYLLKEAVAAVASRDLGKVVEAGVQLKRTEFWGSLALFTVAARVAELAARQGLGRAVLPLAAGMAAVQIASGNFSPKSLLVSTSAFLAAGAAVNLAADAVVYPLLFASGPPGWVAAGAYAVGKLTLTLLLGESLERWILSRFKEGSGDSIEQRSAGSFRSVKNQIDLIGSE